MHLSVGLMRRLARRGAFPTDIPAVLIAAIGRSKPGEPLSMDVAKKLMTFVRTHPRVVVDGFPASLDHLTLLPHTARIGLVWTGKATRMERLLHRASISQRLWIEGRESARETELPRILRVARAKHQLMFIKNVQQDISTIQAVANALIRLDTQ